MSRTINVFTSLVFIYSFIVCITCKQFSPSKVGTIDERHSTEQSYDVQLTEVNKGDEVLSKRQNSKPSFLNYFFNETAK